jgi:hypothetical protein
VRKRSGAGKEQTVFVFFSNRLGCAGSLLLSAAVTVLLIVLFRVL